MHCLWYLYYWWQSSNRVLLDAFLENELIISTSFFYWYWSKPIHLVGLPKFQWVRECWNHPPSAPTSCVLSRVYAYSVRVYNMAIHHIVGFGRFTVATRWHDWTVVRFLSVKRSFRFPTTLPTVVVRGKPIEQEKESLTVNGQFISASGRLRTKSNNTCCVLCYANTADVMKRKNVFKLNIESL